jgi:tetratricopeptide (TPR) repeat protein
VDDALDDHKEQNADEIAPHINVGPWSDTYLPHSSDPGVFMSHNPFEDSPEDRLAELQKRAASTDLTARADALEELAHYYFEDEDTSPRDTMPYVLAALEFSQSQGRDREVGILRYLLSSLHYTLDEYDFAHAEGLEALRIAREQLCTVYMTDVTAMLARIERRNGNLALALDYFAMAHESAMESRLEFWPAFGSLISSAQILGQLEMFNEALEKVEAAYDYAEQTRISLAMVDALNEKAWLLYRLGATDELPELMERIEANLERVKQPWSNEFFAINQCALDLAVNPNPTIIVRLDGLREAARERWNGGAAVALINYLRAEYFATTGDVDQAIKILRQVEILNETETLIRFTPHHLHFKAAQIAIGDARLEQGAELLRKAIDSYPERDDQARLGELRLWLAELELQAGLTTAALDDLQAVPRDAWQPNEAGWMRQSRLLAKTLGSLERHTESLMVANEVLSAVYGSEQDTATQRLAAEMHELKARNLSAIGDSERARSEFEQARDAYAGADDYDSMARVAKALKSTAPEVPSAPLEELL